LRGKYILERIRYSKEEKLADNPMTKPRLILGTFYLIFAFGILLDWFTYFLMVVLLRYDKKEENYKRIREIQQHIRKFNQEINDHPDILFKKHIKVITFDEYLAFLGLSNDIVSNKPFSDLDKLILKNFIKYRKLSIDAMSSDLKFKVLYDEYMKFSQFLNKKK